MTEPTTVLIIAERFYAARVLADLDALPGQLRVLFPDDLPPAVEQEFCNGCARMLERPKLRPVVELDAPDPAPVIQAQGKCVGFTGVPIDRIVFAERARVGSDQVPVWPDLILFYPSPTSNRLWAWAAAAVRVGIIVAVWLPWLQERERARKGAWETVAANFLPFGIERPVVVDRGGFRCFPVIDRETEERLIRRILGLQNALVRVGDDP